MKLAAVAALAFALLPLASVVHAEEPEPLKFTATSGVVFTEHGILNIEIFHTGDSADALEAVGAGDAEAYTIMGVKQTRNPFTFYYNEQYSRASSTTISSAARAWNPYTSEIQVSIAGNTTRTARNCEGRAADGMSVIDWGNLPDTFVGMACWYAAGECDIRLDPWKYGALTAGFWRSLTTHEVGHCLGLGHSEDSDAVMYPYLSEGLAIGPDDLAGLWSLYRRSYWYWR